MKNRTTLKSITFFVIIIVLNSCNQNSRRTSDIYKSTDSLNNVSEKLDLTIIQPKSENREIPKSWKNLGSIQQNWIKVEKDKEGYLIYEPCDGETPTIKLDKGYLLVKPQIEPEAVFVINEFKRTKNNTGLLIYVYPGNTKEISFAYAEIIEPKNGLVLWEIGGEKLLMTPIENAVNFRKIKNNCPDYKRGELKFTEQNKHTE